MNCAESLFLLVGLLTVPAFDLHATTVSLVSSANPAVFGKLFTLTANVNPAAATGKVTFYDGVTVLGMATLSGGTAALSLDLNVTGKRSLVARYLGDGQNSGAVSAPVSITVNSVAASGFTSSNFNMGVFIFDIATGDFNNDGRPDIVAVGAANFVKVALGNGDGTFASPVSSLIPFGELHSVAVGDFNQDGNQDIVFSTTDGNSVAVSFGNGDGTFSGTTIVPTIQGRIVVADFNADGILDLAVVHLVGSQANGTYSVGILLGNGNGTFGTSEEYFLAPYTYNIIAGDVNNDGKVDLVTVVSPAQNDTREVLVLLGNGSGGFSSPLNALSFQFIFNPYDSYALEDMNGDGKADLVLAPGYGYQIGICLGNGDGTFGAPTFYPVTSQLQYTGGSGGISVADFNGDGIFDVLSERGAFVNGRSENFLDLYAGKGDGTVHALGISSTSLYYDNAETANPSLILADFNHDGRIDIATILYSEDTAVQIMEGAVLPLLQVKAGHTGDFTPGQQGATFTLSVNNLPGAAATNSPVTVGSFLGGGLDLVSLSGTGWDCSTTCSRSDPLPPGASYPLITLTVNVQANLSSPQVFEIATLTGGGSSVITDNVDTVDLQVTQPPPAPTLLGPANASSGVSLPLFDLVWTAAAGVTGPTSYDVYFGTSPTPPSIGSTVANFFGPGTLTFGTTYYWRIVAKNSAGSTSSATSSFSTELPPVTVTKIGIFRPSTSVTAEDVDADIAWDAGTDRALFFGIAGDVLIKGDWDGSGSTKLGIFRPSAAMFALDMNGNGVWDPGVDKFGFFGQVGDMPIVGDWTGDGKTKIGIYRPSSSMFALDMNNNLAWDPGIDKYGVFGVSGDTPIVGDWNGGGTAKIGIYRPSTSLFALDINQNLAWDPGFDTYGVFGVSGDTPIVGDWTGDGFTKIGIYRSSASLWALDLNHNLAWDAGTDRAGVFGAPGDLCVVGDWDGTGVTRAGIFRPSTGLWALDRTGNLAWDAGVDFFGVFGTTGDMPIVGRWR